mgnify:CR=1 FL=1
MITVSEKVNDILNRIKSPMTKSEIMKLPVKDRSSTIMYFIKKATETGLVNKYNERGLSYFVKSQKKYQVHKYGEVKYHFLDLENLPGRRFQTDDDPINTAVEIEQDKQKLIFQQIQELKNKKMSRNEICKKLNITRQQLLNIYLFYGGDDDAGSRSKSDKVGSRTNPGTSETDQSRRHTEERTIHHSQLLGQSTQRTSQQAGGEHQHYQRDKSNDCGTSDVKFQTCNQPIERTGEQNHRIEISSKRIDSRSDSVGDTGDQRKEILSCESEGDVQISISHETRQVYGGRVVKPIGVKLMNIHTGKTFELWFNTEKEMILQVGLFCKTDFEYIERIDE